MPKPHSISNILKKRASGVLLHPTSLPGFGPLGTIGKEAYNFLDFMEASRLSVWQMLPLNPPHADGSPYQAKSAFAGDTRLLDLVWLVEQGWIDEEDLDYGSSREGRARLLHMSRIAFNKDGNNSRKEKYEQYIAKNAFWLEDFATFSALHRYHNEASWLDWPTDLRYRNPDVLMHAQKELATHIHQCKFEQFCFYSQWEQLKETANQKNIYLFGDMPIFVSLDSADVWAHREYFWLDEAGKPVFIAGVPPDYFSENGQLWGNPLYNWESLKETNFQWWIDRIRNQLQWFDYIRIDHFRGFESCWAVPQEETTAKNGHWEASPGHELLSMIRQQLDNNLPIIAEDLGVITPSVEALRDKFGFPGMKILQFAFESDANNPYLPHNHIKNCVVYTGTHDNDTTVGWFETRSEHTKRHILNYYGNPEEHMPWVLIRSALASVAQMCIIPLQDFLELDSRARMNTPGTHVPENWRWRFDGADLIPELSNKIREINELYNRNT